MFIEFNPKELTIENVYKLLTGSIVPRPIAFVSTRSSDGINNVAPFSFFNALTGQPPMLMFSISNLINGDKKDTLINIESQKIFVVNIVTEEILERTHSSSVEFRSDVSEFHEVGLTPIPAKKINCPSVKESPIHLECRLEKIIKVGVNFMVIGEIIHFKIREDLIIDKYKIDINKLLPVGRLAGRSYGKLGKIIEMPAPSLKVDKIKKY